MLSKSWEVLWWNHKLIYLGQCGESFAFWNLVQKEPNGPSWKITIVDWSQWSCKAKCIHLVFSLQAIFKFFSARYLFKLECIHFLQLVLAFSIFMDCLSLLFIYFLFLFCDSLCIIINWALDSFHNINEKFVSF